MSDDDFLSMVPSDERRELEERVRDVIETFSSQISVEDIEKRDYRGQVWNEDGAVLERIVRDRWLLDIFRYNPIEKVGEVENLKEYLKKERDFNIGRREVTNLLIDALGESGEHIDDWEHKIPDIIAKLESDIVGQSKIRTKTLLGGLAVENDVKLDDNTWLRAPSEDEVLYKSQTFIGNGLSSNLIHAHSLLELTVPAGEEANNEISLKKRNEFVSFMRLYGRANVSVIVTFREPITYSGMGGYSENMGSRSRNPKYNFNPIDVKRFKNLWSLLEGYTESRGAQYSYPIGIAMDHYDESLRKRTSALSSISFSMIGLESLYRRSTEGASSSKDIARYCGIILSEVVESWNALEIKETIEDAYNFRNSWAHGDRHSDDNQGQVQRRLWDYLRSSIVVFAWLDSRDILDENSLQLEKSMIDRKQRKYVEAVLEDLEIIDYLPIK